MRRILTIDGGGIKGVFPAAFLAELEDRLGQPIAQYFDLIAGTSTGGIIALGLGLGITANESLRLYKLHGHRIFPPRRFGWLMRFLHAKYSHEPLRRILRASFGEKRLGDSGKRLLIPSLNLAAERIHLYKTAHHPALIHDYKIAAVEVGLATVAAPTYFPIHLSPEGLPYIDGSLWARNPLALAVVEAIGILGWPRDDIRVLSLGCTSAHLDLAWRDHLGSGTSYWSGRIAEVFMKAQSSAAISHGPCLDRRRECHPYQPRYERPPLHRRRDRAHPGARGAGPRRGRAPLGWAGRAFP
jgi:patatin-like phospholipase/acyl hydrolase